MGAGRGRWNTKRPHMEKVGKTIKVNCEYTKKISRKTSYWKVTDKKSRETPKVPGGEIYLPESGEVRVPRKKNPKGDFPERGVLLGGASFLEGSASEGGQSSSKKTW